MVSSEWHYHEAGQNVGPIPEENLRDLLIQNRIPASTLIWQKGMAGWKPAYEIFNIPLDAPPLPTLPSTESGEHNVLVIKKTPVVLTIFFTIITAGIYMPCWFLTRRASLNSRKTSEKLGKGVFVFVIALLVVSILLNLIGGALEGISEAYFNAAREEISSSNPRAILSSPAAMKGLV